MESYTTIKTIIMLLCTIFTNSSVAFDLHSCSFENKQPGKNGPTQLIRQFELITGTNNMRVNITSKLLDKYDREVDREKLSLTDNIGFFSLYIVSISTETASKGNLSENEKNALGHSIALIQKYIEKNPQMNTHATNIIQILNKLKKVKTKNELSELHFELQQYLIFNDVQTPKKLYDLETNNDISLTGFYLNSKSCDTRQEVKFRNENTVNREPLKGDNALK